MITKNLLFSYLSHVVFQFGQRESLAGMFSDVSPPPDRSQEQTKIYPDTRKQQGQREDLVAFLGDQDGPLQSSSRKGSMRVGRGTTFFQPEELSGHVNLGK